jgi:hypothetical protein
MKKKNSMTPTFFNTFAFKMIFYLNDQKKHLIKQFEQHLFDIQF